MSTREKGYALEKEFAVFMKEKLGYKECLLNQKVKGKISTNEYEVDVIGKMPSKLRFQRYNIGLALLIFGGVFFLAGFLDIVAIESDVLKILGGGALLGAIVIKINGDNMFDYTWVECKNHKTKIGKDIVNTLAVKVKDNNLSLDKKFDFTKTILVSGSGFITNSLRFAKENSVECYERVSENNFRKINLDEVTY